MGAMNQGQNYSLKIQKSCTYRPDPCTFRPFLNFRVSIVWIKSNQGKFYSQYKRKIFMENTDPSGIN